MLILRATKKLRDMIGGVPPEPEEESSTILGDWYANYLPWRPQVAILVNARTLVSVLTPLAPAKGLPGRVADVVATHLSALDVPVDVVESEREHMREVRVAPTANRVVVGSMNEFVFLSDHRRESEPDLAVLSLKLARTPCGPLYKTYTFPDKALSALVSSHEGARGTE